MDKEIVYIDHNKYVVKTCPKCGGYMQRYELEPVSAALFGPYGKFHCLSCDYVDGGTK